MNQEEIDNMQLIFENRKIFKKHVLTCSNNPENIKNIPENLYNNKDYICSLLENVNCFEYLSDEFRNDKEIFIKALKESKDSILKFASEQLKDDVEVVLNAIIKNSRNFKYASERLKNNDYFIAELVKYEYLKFSSFTKKLRKKYDLVMQVVKNNGYALKYASYDLKDNYDIAVAAINSNPRSVDYASDKLKDDFSVALLAVKQDGTTLRYISKRLQNDFDLVVVAVKKNGLALEYASDDLKDNYDIAFEAIKNNSQSARYVSLRVLRNHKIIQLVYNTRDMQSLKFIKKNVKNQYMSLIHKFNIDTKYELIFKQFLKFNIGVDTQYLNKIECDISINYDHNTHKRKYM